MALHRRTFVKGAATVPLAATAGCMGQFEDAEDPPSYARWVPADGTDTSGSFFIYYDWSALEDFEEIEESLPDEQQPEVGGTQPGQEPPEDADQLLLTPVLVGAFGALALGLSLFTYEFAGDLVSDVSGENATMTGDETDAPDIGETTGMLMTGDAVVMEGEFDTDAIDERAENYEAVDERGDFTIYEGVEGGFISMEGYAFAASEGALVLSTLDEKGRSVVDSMLDTRAGETDRMADRSDDAAWALGTAGHGHVAVGAWGEIEGKDKSRGNETEFDFEPEESISDEKGLGQTDGEVYSVSLSKSELRGEMAAGYSDEDDVPEQETVESQFGHTADEREVTMDDARVAVTGRWELPESTATKN